jgi:hypothetical protein
MGLNFVQRLALNGLKIDLENVEPREDLVTHLRNRVEGLGNHGEGISQVEFLVERLHVDRPDQRRICVRLDMVAKDGSVSVVHEVHERVSGRPEQSIKSAIDSRYERVHR